MRSNNSAGNVCALETRSAVICVLSESLTSKARFSEPTTWSTCGMELFGSFPEIQTRSI